jgi:hypothetical protein
MPQVTIRRPFGELELGDSDQKQGVKEQREKALINFPDETKTNDACAEVGLGSGPNT